MKEKDIESRDDIVLLVDTFYEHVKRDGVLGPKFLHVDWSKHLPIMYRFWSSMLLGEQSYRGQPFQRHLHLELTAEHFLSWIALFKSTVDELFQGTIAEEAKFRAENIARVWEAKLKVSSVR